MYLFAPTDSWKIQFQQEALALELASIVAVEYLHIGSTAVAGLYAKNVIDILGLVTREDDANKLAPALAATGYEYRGDYGIAGRHYFVKNAAVKVHLHIYCQGNQHALNHLWFVECMTQHPEYVHELNTLKMALHQQYPNDKALYQAGKHEFYQRIMRLRPAPL